MPSVWEPINELHEIIAVFCVPLVCGAAVVFGSPIIRLAGLLALFDSYAAPLASMMLDRFDLAVFKDVKSLLVLAGYAAMVWRWPHRWLVAMAALQTFAVFVHLSTWLDRSILYSVNGKLLNVVGWAMIGLLAAVLVVHVVGMIDRRRAASCI